MTTSAVPEPGSLFLLGIGLLGLNLDSTSFSGVYDISARRSLWERNLRFETFFSPRIFPSLVKRSRIT
ncbi:MAG: PEP-CTERM sorting domain-containing protein [Acidobacteriaceae bacterium]|nr:PEP-CTERM sorting domain-containing protein [Acidobacteriaceae bacterium]